jgi:hypothetical protein
MLHRPSASESLSLAARGCRAYVLSSWFLKVSSPARPRVFVATEIFSLGRAHLRHRSIRLAVIIGGVPEQEPDPTLVFGSDYLRLDIFQRCAGVQVAPDL